MTAPPRQYSLGEVKPWVEAAAYELGGRFNIDSVGGYRGGEQGRYGYRDHPLGLALDFMTRDGSGLASYAAQNAEQHGISYVIWNRRIWSADRADEGWRTYNGSNPHIDHVHVSFKDTPPGNFIGRAPGMPGGIGGWDVKGAIGDTGIVGAIKGIADNLAGIRQITDILTRLALPSHALRAAMMGLGFVFLLIGIFFLSRELKNG